MKFQLGTVLCCTLPQPQPQPQPPPPPLSSPPPIDHTSRENQQRRRMNGSPWRPSLGNISEDKISMEVVSIKTQKTNYNSATPKPRNSAYPKEIKQVSRFHMALPAFIPSTFLF